jgi:hypothetical protein
LNPAKPGFFFGKPGFFTNEIAVVASSLAMTEKVEVERQRTGTSGSNY